MRVLVSLSPCLLVRLSLCLCASGVISLLSGCCSSPDAIPKREIRVAAAADLRFALDELVGEFQRQQPNIEVKVTYGSSGNFYAQLCNRAPFDVFLSADIDYPRKLIEHDLAPKNSEFNYAVGVLVLWAPKSCPLNFDKSGIEALLDPAVKKIAIANPKHAPYGRAAEAALKKLGVYDRVADKFVTGENVMQTAQFVDAGADVGLIPLSLALAPAMRDKGRYWEVPRDAYPPLAQGGVVLSWAQDREAANALRDFLAGAEGKAVLRRYGFLIPGE